MSLLSSLCRTVILATTASTSFALPQDAAAQSVPQAYQELFKMSQADKKGLMFYVRGQQIGGGVVRVGSDFVEIRNQTYGRIIIRLDAIDAVAAN